ncbi:TIGR02450 family Trp-rich protein [Vibrio sp. ZSDE26]|uniref:TIGR02450 family Trp-rich protein n=1 Tax=Vibrio amylolyticus TaxID=2847292 RepID=A0A9X1XK30_9VIBR|nr:TIGR02450 family Trp-rich protein [Vibrio amylolyticus]MCK6264717.1 TIGR02450 family Trp-rich protein [Vibrio amylolyticus]
MNRINPQKLLYSKWTATNPNNREKHFLISEVEFNEDGSVILCKLEAVITHNEYLIDWPDLKDKTKWLQGWK